MAEELVQTLEAHEGKKEGEAIASYGRSIVFLPKGVQPGENVRVILKEIREDSRVRMMYRGVPANDEYSDSWKDNGDGTGSRVTIATDWKGSRSEVGVVETRGFQKREGSPSTQSNLKVIWGNDLASSVIEDSQVRLTPLEEEKVENGQLVWQKAGERRGEVTVTEYPVELEEITNGDWYNNRKQVVYRPEWSVLARINAITHGGKGGFMKFYRFTYATMPEWWQTEQEAKLPVCACGRNRYDVNNPDGYAKCEKCREEEHCIRCGKQAKVTVIDGHLTCDICRPYAEQEGLVARSLNVDHLAAIVEEARGLLALRPLKKEEGEAILKATVGLASFRQMESYGWYYFGPLGEIYGTKLAPAALLIIENLPSATGNGLVELMSWIAGGPKPASPSADHYLATQVEGKQAVPALTENRLKQVMEKLQGRQPVLANLLRGPTVDLEKILPDLRKKWLATSGEGNPEGGPEGGVDMAYHRLEKYGKEFIRLQFGREYASLGNSARRHSVLEGVIRAISGNWEALRGLRPLTSQAVAWLKDHTYVAGYKGLKEVFRGVPSFEKIKSDLRELAPLPEVQLDEIASREQKELLRRREEDFWKFLGTHPSNPPEPDRQEAPASTAMAQAMRKAGLLV